MTKRIHWRHWQEITRVQRTEPRHHIDGDLVQAILEELPPFHPSMHHLLDLRCFACDQLIERGHTIFTCKPCPDPAPVLCYACGIGWEMFQDRLTANQAATIPPVGGPLT